MYSLMLNVQMKRKERKKFNFKTMPVANKLASCTE